MDSDSEDLFSINRPAAPAPLAHRLRPKTLAEWVGHDRLLGDKGIIRSFLQSKNFPSILLWGPPGVGKTSLAILIAESLGEAFIQLSAVNAGVKEIKEAADKARGYQMQSRRTVLFFDEIHRLNKSQQDALLPYVEKGLFILIGATTENPSFEVNAALLSRLRVIRLDRLTPTDLITLIRRALISPDGYSEKLKLSEEAIELIADQGEGDARRVLTLLDAAVSSEPSWLQNTNPTGQTDHTVSASEMQDVLKNLGDRVMPYDKKSEEHYNVISAFIKSMRASDPDAAVYYLARMLESGEDPMFIVRRMIVFASEDIGNAEPRGLLMAIAAKEALQCVGLPEARINLAHAAISLALAKKNRAVYEAIESAIEEVKTTGAQPVPMALRNPVTKLMKDQGYGRGNPNERLPEGLKNKKFYILD